MIPASEILAVLMAHAPATPKSFHHRGLARQPDASQWLKPLEVEAARFTLVFEGDQTSLIQLAYGLAEYFADQSGDEDMDAANYFEEAIEIIRQTTANVDQGALLMVRDKLDRALEAYGAEYRAYRTQAQADEAARELAWREEWARRILEAAKRSRYPEDAQ